MHVLFRDGRCPSSLLGYVFEIHSSSVWQNTQSHPYAIISVVLMQKPI